MRSECVQSVFRVHSVCVQSVFRVCSILMSFHHLAHLVCQFLAFFAAVCSESDYKSLLNKGVCQIQLADFVRKWGGSPPNPTK